MMNEVKHNIYNSTKCFFAFFCGTLYLKILTKEDTFILLHGFIDKSNWFITHTTGSLEKYKCKLNIIYFFLYGIERRQKVGPVSCELSKKSCNIAGNKKS